MKPWKLLGFVAVLASCSAAKPIVFSDPAFDVKTVKGLHLVIEDRSGLGDLSKNQALMQMTLDQVTKGLTAKGYSVTYGANGSVAEHILLAQVDAVQRSKRYIPHPITVRALPVSCEIKTSTTFQQLRRVTVDGYRPNSARTAASWINDPSRLYPISILDACGQVLVDVPIQRPASATNP